MFKWFACSVFIQYQFEGCLSGFSADVRVSLHFTSLKEMGPPTLTSHPKILQPEWELERNFTQTWQFSRPVWDWRPNNGGSVVGRATSLLPLLRGAYWTLLKLQDPEEFAGTLLSLFPKRHWINCLFLLSTITLSLLVGLLRTGDQTWIGAHTGCILQDNNTLEQSVTDISQWKPPCSWGKHTNVWHCLFFVSTVYLRNMSLYFGHKSRSRKKIHILRASEPGGHHGKAN